MKDTPADIRQKQAAIFNKMTTGERIAICLSMAEEGRRLVEMKLEEQHPDWSRGEVVAAAFERIYRDSYPADERARIAESIRAYHSRK